MLFSFSKKNCFFNFSDTFENFKNVKVEIKNWNVNSNDKEAENSHKKGNTKLQFNTDQANHGRRTTVHVLNKGAGVSSVITKKSLGNVRVSFNNDLCNTYHKKKGHLVEKSLNHPSPDTTQSLRITVSSKYNKSRRDIEDYVEDLTNKTAVRNTE